MNFVSLLIALFSLYCLPTAKSDSNKKCKFAGKKYKKGVFQDNAIALDGADGWCLTFVLAEASYLLANESCAQNLIGGQLMKEENKRALWDDWKKTASKHHQSFIVDFPRKKPLTVCSAVFVNSSFIDVFELRKVKCSALKNFICQFPYHYNCGYAKRQSLSSNKTFIETEIVTQDSDFDKNKNCEIAPIKKVPTLPDLQKCTVVLDVFETWTPWATCSASCTNPYANTPAQFRVRKIDKKCVNQYPTLKNYKLDEHRTCNTAVQCPDDVVNVTTTSSASGTDFSDRTETGSKTESSHNGRKTSDDAMSSDSPLTIVIGAIAGFVVLILIILIVVLVVKKKKKASKKIAIKKTTGKKLGGKKSDRENSDKKSAKDLKKTADKDVEKKSDKDKSSKNVEKKSGKDVIEKRKPGKKLSEKSKTSKDPVCTTSICADMSVISSADSNKSKKTHTVALGAQSSASSRVGKSADSNLSLPAISRNADIFTYVKPKATKDTKPKSKKEKKM